MPVHLSRKNVRIVVRRVAVALTLASTLFFGQSVKKACAGCEYPWQVTTTYWQARSCYPGGPHGSLLCTEIEPYVVGHSYLACDMTYTTDGNTTNYSFTTEESLRCPDPICD
jgi:hypothetical protein